MRAGGLSPDALGRRQPTARSEADVRPILKAATVCVLLSAGTAPQASELAVQGLALAGEHCAKCHAIGADDASPHKITPPLRDLAARYPIAMLRRAQKTGILAGHDEMPEFDLGKDGVKALLTYIDSLNPKGPQYLRKAP